MNRREFLRKSMLSMAVLGSRCLTGKGQAPEERQSSETTDFDIKTFLPLVVRENQDGSDSMASWRAARDASGSSIANVLFIGDSITYGINIANAQLNGFVGLIRTELQTAYGDTGIGLVPVFNTNQDIHWVTGGTSAWERTGYGIMRGGRKGNGADETLTFTASCDAFDVQYIKDSSFAIFTYTLDGGVPKNTGGAGTFGQSITHIDCGSLGEHTLVITSPASGDCIIDGVYATKGTTGVRVHNAGRDGGTVLWATTQGANLGYVDLIQPKLSVIGLTVNDYNSQTELSTYHTALNTIVAKCKTYGSVVVVAGNPYNISKAIPQTTYNAEAQNVASANGAAFLNMYARWGSYAAAAAAGYMSADPVHPTLAGQADYKTAIMAVIQ
jgi:hypothetical protein